MIYYDNKLLKNLNERNMGQIEILMCLQIVGCNVVTNCVNIADIADIRDTAGAQDFDLRTSDFPEASAIICIFQTHQVESQII